MRVDNMLNFNQELTVFHVKEEGMSLLMEIDSWSREYLIEFLENLAEVGKLTVDQETDRGMTLTDGNHKFAVVLKSIADKAIEENE